MAIVDARLQRTLKLTESVGDKGTKKLTGGEDYLIVCDAANPNFTAVLDDTATYTNLSGGRLPQLYDELTVSGATIYVSSRELSYYDGSDRVLVMSVKYDARELPGGSQNPEAPNGTDERTWRRITARTQQATVPCKGWNSVAEATAQNPAAVAPVNSCGDPVEGIEEDDGMVSLTYTNPLVQSPNFFQLNRYVNTCNGGQFLGGDEYTVRCLGWSGEYDEKAQAWSISVEFLYKRDGWQIKFLDAGFNEIKGGQRVAVVDGKGNPVSQPVPLDGAGVALAANYGSWVTRTIYPYRVLDLTQLCVDCNIHV